MKKLRAIVLFVCVGSILACSDSPTGPRLPGDGGDDRPPPNKPAFGQMSASPMGWLA